MLRYLLIILIIISNIGFGQLNHAFSIDNAKRDDGNLYLWVYFKDKGQSLKKVHLSDKTIARRKRNNPEKDISWYDLDPPANYIESILNTGATLRGQSRWFNAISIICNEDQLSEMSLLPFVKEISPLAQYQRTIISELSVDRILDKSFTLSEADYGSSFDQLEQINIPAVHDAGYYGNGISILVLDSGYNLDHPVFDSLNVIAEWDVINDDSTTKNEDGQDIGSQQNHGTSVLSIMGGYTKGTLIGPAFKSDYILAKTEVIGSETSIEEDYFVLGLEWGEARGADIVTTSVGYIDWYTPENMDGNTALITKAYDIAAGLGVLCIAAAGNENGNYWDTVTPPADADSVISVGAVNNEGIITYFSSRGPTVDGRTKPEVCAWGDDTYLAVGSISYRTGDGTSYAAPLVAGAAALVMEAHPDWPSMIVRKAIMQTASQSNSPDEIYGWGIMDTWAAINYDTSSLFIPELNQNFPNPFNPNTTIKYELRQSSNVKLVVFDILGREVKTLVNRFEPSGIKSVKWNGITNSGFLASTGVYFYSLIINDNRYTKKMLLIK